MANLSSIHHPLMEMNENILNNIGLLIFHHVPSTDEVKGLLKVANKCGVGLLK